MATLRWLGTAGKVAQVQNFTMGGTWETTDVIRCTIGTVSFDTVAGSTNTTTIAATLAAAWEALTAANFPQFAELTATSNGADFILTGEAGLPFTVTLTPLETNLAPADDQTIEGSGTATTGTTTTSCSSPNDWSLAANWDTGAIPVDNDTVIIENSAVDILYGLSQSGIDLTALHVKQSYTGKIGLPKRNAGVSNVGYEEYRTDYLTLGTVTTLNIGEGPGTGSGRLKFNVGSNACTANIYNTGKATEAGLYSVIWKGTHASNVLNVNRGSVDVAPFSGETATVVTLRLGFVELSSTPGIVRCSSGVTLTTVTNNGGTLETNSAIATAMTNISGTATLRGSGNIAQLTVSGGTVRYNSTGTLGGNTVVSEDGWLDFSQDQLGKTVTNPIEIHGSAARVTDPNKVVATLVLDLNHTPAIINGELANGTHIGTNVRITRGTPA